MSKMKQALADHTNTPVANIEVSKHKYFGLKVFDVDGQEYAIAKDEAQANKAAGAYILDTLWAFNASFIGKQIGLDYKGIEGLQMAQEKLCEDANGLVAAMIKNKKAFIRAAIEADGRGHFLASYDGEEVRLGGGYLAYRIN